MGSVDASVNNISKGASSGRGIIDVAGGATSLVGEVTKAPWSTSLSGQGAVLDLNIIIEVPDLISLDEFDIIRSFDLSNGLIVEGSCVGGDLAIDFLGASRCTLND